MTSVTRQRTGNPGLLPCKAAVSPKVAAIGAIAHSRNALGSKSSQCSRRPTAWKAGMRGTASRANPFRAAHQLAATAMAKAKVAVYSASSLDGYTLLP